MNDNLKIIAEFIDQASAGLKKAQSQLEEMTRATNENGVAQEKGAKATKAGADATAGSINPLQMASKAMLAWAAGIGVAALAWQGFTNALAEADKMDDLSQKTGIAASTLRDMSFMAEQSGTSLDALVGAMSKLGKAADLSDEAATKQAKTFKQLGIDTMAANGQLKSSEQLFGEVAEAFRDIEDGPEKSAAAFRLFGSEAKNLMPLLNMSAKELADMKQEMADLAMMTPDAYDAFAKATNEMNDNFAKAGSVATGFFSVLGAELVPVINVMAEAFINSAKEGGLLRQIMTGLVEAFKFMIPYVKAGAEIFSGFVSTVQIAGKSIGAVMAAIATVASGGGIAGLKAVWSAYKDDVQQVAQSHVDFTTKLNDTGKAAAVAAPQLDKPKRSIQSLRKEATATVWELDKLIKTLKDYTPDYYLGNDPTTAAHAKDMQLADEAFERDRKNGMKLAAAEDKRKKALEQADRNAEIRRKVAAENRADELRDLNYARLDELELAQYENTLTGKTASERERLLEVFKQERQVRKEIGATMLAGDSDKIGQMLTDTNARANAIKKVGEETRIANEIFDQSLSVAQDNFSQRIQIAVKMFEQGKISLADFTKYQQDQYDQLLGKSKDTAEKSTVFWEEAAKGMQDAMQTFFYDIMQGNMTNLVDDFQKMISKMVAQALAANLAEKLFGTTMGKGGAGGYIGAAANWLGNFFGGARATGGPVSAGRAYLVGENRPELFVPDTSGTIIPSVDGIGGGGITVQMHVNTMDAKSFLGNLAGVERELSTMVHNATLKYNLGR